ncbi:hypothetical protein AOLI_G00030910 [Acnodon oligacanthus]
MKRNNGRTPEEERKRGKGLQENRIHTYTMRALMSRERKEKLLSQYSSSVSEWQVVSVCVSVQANCQISPTINFSRTVFQTKRISLVLDSCQD